MTDRDAPASLTWSPGIERTRSGGTPVVHPGPPPLPEVDTDADAMLALFTAACEAVGGTVHHLASTASVATLVSDVCDGKSQRAVLAWDQEELPLPGVHGALQESGLTLVSPTLASEGMERQQDLSRLDGAGAGVTGAFALLADTGSLVLTSGKGRPRLASLLPPVHVALVRRDQLVPSLGALFTSHPRLAAEAANLVVITGPSRTADIEMTLTRGVHGPRSVHVVFVS